jgi:hypothetical protein
MTDDVTDLKGWKYRRRVRRYKAEYERLRPQFEAMLETSGTPYCFVMECLRQAGMVAPTLGIPLDVLIEQLRGEYDPEECEPEPPVSP